LFKYLESVYERYEIVHLSLLFSSSACRAKNKVYFEFQNEGSFHSSSQNSLNAFFIRPSINHKESFHSDNLVQLRK